MSETRVPGFGTLCIHAGQEPEPVTGAVSVPIFQTSTYAQDALGSPRGGFEYARSKNPTRLALEALLAALEGGAAAHAFASGQAAIASLATAHLAAGDHVVVSRGSYGGTWRYFTKVLANFGVTFSWVDTTDLAAVRASAGERQTYEPLAVGVFGDGSAEAVVDMVDVVGLDAVQLHGSRPDAGGCRREGARRPGTARTHRPGRPGPGGRGRDGPTAGGCRCCPRWSGLHSVRHTLGGPVGWHGGDFPLGDGPGGGRGRALSGRRGHRPSQPRGRAPDVGCAGGGRVQRGGAVARRQGRDPTARPVRLLGRERNDVLTTPHRFGPYGGRYVPETLVSALEELEAAYETYRDDPAFLAELRTLLRPTTPAGPRRSSWPTACRSGQGAASTSSGRT